MQIAPFAPNCLWPVPSWRTAARSMQQPAADEITSDDLGSSHSCGSRTASFSPEQADNTALRRTAEFDPRTARAPSLFRESQEDDDR